MGQSNSFNSSGEEKRYFYSKLLLFGEYSVIKDSMALAMPYPAFKGRLRFPHNQKEKVVDQELKSFALYIKKHTALLDELECSFDLPSFNFDISQGLRFDSSIPVGFGVGSSGALCAALFDRYGALKNERLGIDPLHLKKVFAFLEGHFHGASSGVDPLISYLGKAILIKQKDELLPVQLPDLKRGQGAIFLINTGRPRRTEPLVNLFLEKCKSEQFSSLCQQELLPITNNCINSFLEQRFSDLLLSFKELSKFQFENFTPMIPKLYMDIWEQGLEKGSFSMKLCGAGGGGFLLGITADFARAYEQLDGFDVKPIFRFL